MLKCMLLLLLTLGLAEAQGDSKTPLEDGDKPNSGDKPVPQIYNGEDAAKGEFPFMARIKGYGWDHYCGGVLVSNTVVLTAAYCLLDYNWEDAEMPHQFSVVLGDFSVTADEDEQVEVNAHRVYLHPDFDKDAYDYEEYDIADRKGMAALILNEPVRTTGAIEAIDIYADGKLEVGKDLTAIGWGYKDDYTGYSDILQKLTYPIADLDACRAWHASNWYWTIPETMFCTGKIPHQSHTWDADEGGPLVWWSKDDAKYYLYGLVLYGVHDESGYDVNVYVPGMLEFITKVKAIEVKNYVALENPKDSATQYEGIAVFYAVGEKPYTVCTDGMINPGVTAKLICKDVGFYNGVITNPLLYKKKKQFLMDGRPSFVKVNLDCNDENVASVFKCDAIDYASAKTPCFEQDLLAVKCWNDKMDGFTFSVIKVTDHTTEITGGTSRGTVLAKIMAVKNGYKIDPKLFHCDLYNAEVHSDGSLNQLDYVDSMYHRKKIDHHSTKIKGNDELQKKCLVVVCVMEIPAHKVQHAIKSDGAEACGDPTTLETELVPAYLTPTTTPPPTTPPPTTPPCC